MVLLLLPCASLPQVVMVLGSGLGPIADAVQDATVIPYGDIPHFHAPGVQGHPGKLVIGHFNGVPALVLQVGRPTVGGSMQLLVWLNAHGARSCYDIMRLIRLDRDGTQRALQCMAGQGAWLPIVPFVPSRTSHTVA
jgi:hypothetical protein